MSLTLGTPTTFFTAVAAGATLAKTLWPGTYTVTLPTKLSGSMANITSSSNVIGGVIAPQAGINALMIDFAGVGSADLTLVVEIGKLNASGAIAIPIASVSLKSITTSGTVANTNPFTGDAVAATTYRLFDLATLTNYGDFNQLSLNVGGTENQLPSQLLLTMEEGVWYYFIVTSLGTLTSALCVVTPTTAVAKRVGPTRIADIGAGEYETVAASQTDQALGATGAIGDYLLGVLIVPGTSAAGAVSIKDGGGSSISIFAGGATTALPTLAPFFVPLGIYSTAGAWSVTTGANVTAIGVGNFT